MGCNKDILLKKVGEKTYIIEKMRSTDNSEIINAIVTSCDDLGSINLYI
jgi:hypothetical protein